MRWDEVLATSGNADPRPEVAVTATAAASEAAVTIRVSPDAPGPVEFGDGLYGATAWSRDADGGWTRADTAEMRLMIMRALQPGESAEVTLPLRSGATTVRVVVGGAWADAEPAG